jgi:transcriptional regulator with XRE-family HTH domain
MTPNEMKERRKELKLTQAEVAKRIGITLRHYSRLELGICPMTNVMQKVVKMELEV